MRWLHIPLICHLHSPQEQIPSLSKLRSYLTLEVYGSAWLSPMSDWCFCTGGPAVSNPVQGYLVRVSGLSHEYWGRVSLGLSSSLRNTLPPGVCLLCRIWCFLAAILQIIRTRVCLLQAAPSSGESLSAVGCKWTLTFWGWVTGLFFGQGSLLERVLSIPSTSTEIRKAA